MEFKNLLKAQNRDELRQWLTENHSKESECWGDRKARASNRSRNVLVYRRGGGSAVFRLD